MTADEICAATIERVQLEALLVDAVTIAEDPRATALIRARAEQVARDVVVRLECLSIRSPS